MQAICPPQLKTRCIMHALWQASRWCKSQFFGLIREFKFPLFWPETTTNHSKADQIGQLFLRGMPSVTSSCFILVGRNEKTTIFAFLCAESSRIAVNTRVHSQALHAVMFRVTLDHPLFLLSHWAYLSSHDCFFLAFIRVTYSCWGIHTMQFLLLRVCIKILYLK